MTKSSSNPPTCSSSLRDATTLGTAMTVSDFTSLSKIQPSGTGQLPISRIARLIHEDESGVAPAAAGMPPQRGHLDLQFCRHPKVVGVEKSDIFALRIA